MLKTFDYNKMPIVEAVNEIMVDAAKRGASDIHFDPLENVMKIRIRIDGTLIDYALVPNDIKKNLITRIKIIAGMNITESRLPQDGAIKATVQGTSLDLRVSTIPTNMGEKIVIRILDYSLSGAGIENLGFSDKNYKKVIEMINQPNGIILVTGATGTGKSTTVYAVLQRLNKESTNIITVEDPVEMNIEGVNQIQANSEIGLDFATALRSILRQDPNIIMIGEIRDTETAKIAIRASITGHLVLSTLHTNDSLNTIERLLDMDVERYLLASSLSGIISQRLARRLCPHCRIEREANQYEKKLFEASLGHSVDKLYSANKAGCEHCHGGFAGRIAIQEVLLINQQIRDAISANKSKEELRDLVYNEDVDSLLQDGLSKVEQGITSMEELLKLIELENENATIARMGMEAAQTLGDNLEEQIIEDEIKAKPANNIEIDESLLEDNNADDKTKIEDNYSVDSLLDDITDSDTKEEEIIPEVEPEVIPAEELKEDNNDSIDNLLNDITDNDTKEEEIVPEIEPEVTPIEEVKEDNNETDDLLNDITDNDAKEEIVPEVEPEVTPIEEVKEDNNETDEDNDEDDDNQKIFGFFGKKKKKKDKKEEVKEEPVEEIKEQPTSEFDELSLDKLDDFNFDSSQDTTDFSNFNFDDIKLNDDVKEDNSLNLDDLDLGELKATDEDIKNPDDLKLDDLKLDDLKLDDANNLSFDDIKLDDSNNLNLDELTFDDKPAENNDISFDHTFDNTDNIDINNLDLSGLNTDDNKPVEIKNDHDELEETGKLDDDLSSASDDDIMNLFN